MSTASFTTVDEWLDWQWRLHPEKIELGLERVAQVAKEMDVVHPAPYVITLAGTNGKGSSAALIEETLVAAGHSVAVYTSPHLLHYNERLRINKQAVSDTALCDAFMAVEAARGGQTLSYFEFGSLAIFHLIKNAQVDVAILEVGLGGRLDAVNVIGPDIALITNIGLDHQSWLGDSREAIAIEKAGIMRSGRVVICNDENPPATIAQEADRQQAKLFMLGRDYCYTSNEQSWSWQGSVNFSVELPLPACMPGQQFIQNAAGVLALLQQLPARLACTAAAFQQALEQWRVPGRCEWRTIAAKDCLFDVAHNVESATALAKELAAKSAQEIPNKPRTLAVFAALQDKPIEEMLQCVASQVDAWYFADLVEVERGATATQLQAKAETIGISGQAFTSVEAAWSQMLDDSDSDDRLLVFGSFHTVEAVYKAAIGDFDG